MARMTQPTLDGRSQLFPVLPNTDFCLVRLRNNTESVKHETNQLEAKTFRRSASNVRAVASKQFINPQFKFHRHRPDLGAINYQDTASIVRFQVRFGTAGIKGD
jgi:hypothetical protein